MDRYFAYLGFVDSIYFEAKIPLPVWQDVFSVFNRVDNSAAATSRLSIDRVLRLTPRPATVVKTEATSRRSWLDIESHSSFRTDELDTMSWVILFIAALFEVAWAIGLEYSDGLSKPVPTVGTAIALIISMVLLAKAVQELPIGTAYAVWTGIGAVGTATLGIVLFDEPATGARLAFISVIIFGIVGLQLVSGGH